MEKGRKIHVYLNLFCKILHLPKEDLRSLLCITIPFFIIRKRFIVTWLLNTTKKDLNKSACSMSTSRYSDTLVYKYNIVHVHIIYLHIWTLDFLVKDEGFLDLVSCHFVNCIWSTQGKFIALYTYLFFKSKYLCKILN